MSTIRLEYDKPSAASILAELLNDRLCLLVKPVKILWRYEIDHFCVQCQQSSAVVRKLLLQTQPL